MHSNLSLVNLEFQVIHRLHDSVSFLPQLRQKAYIMHIVVVNILDQIWLNHATRNRVLVLNALFKVKLQLLILVQLLLIHLVLPL